MNSGPDNYGNGTSKTDDRFSGPLGLVLGPDGTLYVADPGNHRIRTLSALYCL